MLELKSRNINIFDDGVNISYEFLYNGVSGIFTSVIDNISEGLWFSLEFNNIEFEWGECVTSKGSNNFNSEFKEVFEKVFFVKIP